MQDSISTKVISTQALIALKNALTYIYWRKLDIRKFVEFTIENKAIVSTIDWHGQTKLKSVSQLIERMAARRNIYNSDLLTLIHESSNFNDFSHLYREDDADKKVSQAKNAVEKLRNHASGYFEVIKEKQQALERKVKYQEAVKTTLGFSQRLEELKGKFYEIATTDSPQKRGFTFEKLLNEILILFDLDPKAAYKIGGEQIDGAFTFQNTEYLLEAKWQKEQVNLGTLYTFGGKISGRLKTTLGLFISLDGFSPEVHNSNSETLKSIILMDGGDLIQVLEGRISLQDMLYSKRRQAAFTGNMLHKLD